MEEISDAATNTEIISVERSESTKDTDECRPFACNDCESSWGEMELEKMIYLRWLLRREERGVEDRYLPHGIQIIKSFS